MLDADSSSGLLQRALIWGLMAFFFVWSLLLNWFEMSVILQLLRMGGSVNWCVTWSLWKNSLFRSRVPWRSQGVFAAQMNLFLFVFSFSRLISHLIKPCLSFWGFCHFFSVWDHTRRTSWLGLGWGNLQKAIVHSSIIKSCSLASICPVAYILEHNSKHFQEDNQQKHRLIIAFRLQQDLKQDKYVCSPHLCLTENWSASPGQEGF